MVGAGLLLGALVACSQVDTPVDPDGDPPDDQKRPSVFFTSPTIGGIGPGSVRKQPGGIVVASVSDPTGLAVDAAGNIYFGEVTAPPVRVSLKKRSPDGSVQDLGVVVDTTGGFVSGSWTFDIAISAAGDVYYTTPEIRIEQSEIIRPGSITKLGAGVVVDVVDNPVGLAVDAAGSLYFGSMATGPVRVTLMRRGVDGTVSALGTVVDTSAGYISASWTFDIATTPSGDILFTTPAIRIGAAASSTPARLRSWAAARSSRTATARSD